MRVLVTLLVLFPVAYAVGGMAELKSITGDAPYLGPGNAPAPIPQPMGFWGRPRFGYGSSMYSNLYGGGYYGGQYGGPSPYTSVAGSPYASRGLPIDSAEDEPVPRGSGLLSSLLSAFTSPSSPINSPIVARSSPNFNPASSPASGSSSLSSATGGGFYKGRGNSFANN